MAALLTIPEAAEAARLSTSSVKRKIASGELEAVRVGERSVRVWSDSVLDLLTRGYQPRQAESEAA